jgi:hypothetical protein
MKLKNCLEMGWICGLKEIGEAVNNVCYHSMMLFSYENIEKEEEELFLEFDDKDLRDEYKIKDVLWNLYQVNTDDIDKQLDEDLKNLAE